MRTCGASFEKDATAKGYGSTAISKVKGHAKRIDEEGRSNWRDLINKDLADAAAGRGVQDPGHGVTELRGVFVTRHRECIKFSKILQTYLLRCL